MRTCSNIGAFSLARELLHEGQSVDVCVRGQSMLPFFRSGSVIRLRPLRPGDLRRGNVVLGETDGGHFVVHRILRVDAEVVTLLGDGNVAGTERIAAERIHGIVGCGGCRVERTGRKAFYAGTARRIRHGRREADKRYGSC